MRNEVSAVASKYTCPPKNFLTNLPDDKEALKAMLRSLWQERERLEKRADEQQRKAEEQRQRADELYLEKLRLQLELERYKKATYGPRADRLSMNQLAQMLLEFAEALEQKPSNLEDRIAHPRWSRCLPSCRTLSFPTTCRFNPAHPD